MNISNGISQVIYQTSLGNGTLLKTAFVWPKYNAGRINPVQEITGRNAPENTYFKSTFKMNNISHTETFLEVQYDSKGKTKASDSYPGRYFEAIG